MRMVGHHHYQSLPQSWSFIQAKDHGENGQWCPLIQKLGWQVLVGRDRERDGALSDCWGRHYGQLQHWLGHWRGWLDSVVKKLHRNFIRARWEFGWKCLKLDLIRWGRLVLLTMSWSQVKDQRRYFNLKFSRYFCKFLILSNKHLIWLNHQVYNMTVRAFDLGTPSLYSDVNVKVFILDQNDHAPKVPFLLILKRVTITLIPVSVSITISTFKPTNTRWTNEHFQLLSYYKDLREKIKSIPSSKPTNTGWTSQKTHPEALLYCRYLH